MATSAPQVSVLAEGMGMQVIFTMIGTLKLHLGETRSRHPSTTSCENRINPSSFGRLQGTKTC